MGLISVINTPIERIVFPTTLISPLEQSDSGFQHGGINVAISDT